MSNSIKESTLYLFADSISDPEVVANPEAAEKLFKLVSVLRRGLCSEADFCDSIKRAVAGAYNQAACSELRPFPVRFQLSDRTIYRTTVSAYSNGGAENKILDLLPGKCVRCLAFDPADKDETVADSLYPAPISIDCMEVYRLAQ